MKFFLKLYHSPIVQYIGVRYFTYGLQFINSVLIAKYLGVYYFGIYSFLQLVKQYLFYTGMPPSYSLNTILSTCKNDIYKATKLWQNSLLISIILTTSIFFLGIIIINNYPNLFLKYEFNQYALYILLIFSLNSINFLFVNFYRTYGLLKKINFFEFIVPFFQFIVLFLASEKELLYLILIVTIIANAISLLIFLYNPPLKIGVSFDTKTFMTLLIRGFHLLLYNVSFSLILISSRTIVSIYYSPEELGYYTFAVNLSNAVFMIVGAFGFVIYPKLLNKIYRNNNNQTKNILNKIHVLYIPVCYILTYLGFFSCIFLEYVLPEYSTAIDAFKILLITQLILNSIFGYSVVLISNKKERLMTINALFSMIIVVIISYVFILFKFSFTIISIAVMCGFIIYCIRITVIALKEIDCNYDIRNVLKNLFPYYYLIPISFLFISIIFDDNIFMPLLSLFIFISINKNKILNIYRKLFRLIEDKNILNF